MRDRLRALVAKHGLGRLLPDLERMILPGIRLETEPVGQEDLAAGESRIGGVPDLPAGFSWPRWNEGPLAFVAQLRLDDLAAWDEEGILPKRGTLAFFYDPTQQGWGFDPAHRGSGRVFLFGPHLEHRPASPPRDLPGEGLFRPRRVEGHPISTFPPPDSRYTDRLGLSWHPGDDPRAPRESPPDRSAYFELIEEAERELGLAAPYHQLLGHPRPVQNEMQLECQLVSNGISCGDPRGYEDPRRKGLEAGADDWRLLFQLDSDDDAAMIWGDLGMVYFWIRLQDLRKGDFEKTWTVLQCG